MNDLQVLSLVRHKKEISENLSLQLKLLLTFLMTESAVMQTMVILKIVVMLKSE